MSFQPDFPGFSSGTAEPVAVPNAPTDKQLNYATAIAARVGTSVPHTVLSDRAALSAWINGHKNAKPSSRFANYPSSKQVAFAERIARVKRRDIPREAFHDRALMARWIDCNKPH